MPDQTREARLRADAEAVSHLFQQHPYLTVESIDAGNLTTRYRAIYRVPGVVRLDARQLPVLGYRHVVEIFLHDDYPTTKPTCTAKTPLFHPNIGPRIALGDHWAPSESLVDILVTISKFIQYQTYNPKSPLNSLAARWASGHEYLFPVGTLELDPRMEIDLHHLPVSLNVDDIDITLY